MQKGVENAVNVRKLNISAPVFVPEFVPMAVQVQKQLETLKSQYFPKYGKCECCRGYVYDCKNDEMCIQLGECHCHRIV